MSWRDLGADELEYQFNPRRTVPDFEAHQNANAQLSVEVRARLEGHLDLAYGETALQKVDLFPARPRGKGPAPVHVFFHGGYWRAQDKANFAFVAEHLVERGICAVIANYDLCPAVTLDGVVAAARRAIAWTYRHAALYGADPERLTLSGSSAGRICRRWRSPTTGRPRACRRTSSRVRCRSAGSTIRRRRCAPRSTPRSG
jgi:arylformamidase